MSKTFGEFREDFPHQNHEFLILGFSSRFIPLQKRWRNNGLAADFAADYLGTFFPDYTNDESHQTTVRKITESVNYITNELLENALKYNDTEQIQPIQLGLHLFDEDNLKIVLEVKNTVPPQKLEEFQSFIQEFIEADPDDFYLHQLEQSFDNDQGTGVGLISIKNDYGAKIGWQFNTTSTSASVITTVTTMVQLEYSLQGVFSG